jgi:hypothetical protein
MLRANILTWFGVLGGAITLFSSLQTVLVLADWVHWAVGLWKTWMHGAWSKVFNWIGVSVRAELYPILTFAVFAIAIAVAARLTASSSRAAELATADTGSQDAPGFPAGRRNVALTLLVLSVAMLSIVYWGSTHYFWTKHTEWHSDTISLLYLVPAIMWIALAHDRARAAQVTGLMIAFSIVLMFLPIRDWSNNPLQFESTDRIIQELLEPSESLLDPAGHAWEIALVGAITFHCLIVFSMIYAPIRALARRSTFILIGLVFILALNEGAKMELSRYLLPPGSNTSAQP